MAVEKEREEITLSENSQRKKDHNQELILVKENNLL